MTTFAAVVWDSFSTGLGFGVGPESARDTLVSPRFCLFLYKTDSNTFNFQLYWRRINSPPLLPGAPFSSPVVTRGYILDIKSPVQNPRLNLHEYPLQ